jgi:saccharopine dehydrogenase (NAD+, L-lysine forming)
MIIGMRREDKNRWERRAPLTPEDVQRISASHGTHFVVQPSTSLPAERRGGLPLRVYPDEAYARAGARVAEDLSSCDLILGVKEMPTSLFRPGGAYLFFSHTIKCQPFNMPMLKHLLELGGTLLDYELIADEQNRRKVFFGRHAGLAGMIDTLSALGQRLAVEGIPSPFAELKMAHEYASLADAQAAVLEVGGKINALGFDERITPLVVGFAGYGNVSKGAQEILDLLPTHALQPAELPDLRQRRDIDSRHVYKVEFKEVDMFVPRDPSADFDLHHYFQHPEQYTSIFERYAPHMNVLINGIYWNDKVARLVTKAFLKNLYATGQPHLRVIGDISCDILGSIEATVRATTPDEPCFVYDAQADSAHEGYEGRGPVIMAVDNLPCELALESSQHFSASLHDFVTELVEVDITRRDWLASLSYPLRQSVIAFRGELEPRFHNLADCIKRLAP